MNEYEREREERIARNKAMLATLRVTQLASRAETVVVEQEQKEVATRQRREQAFKPTGPARRSARVKSLPSTTTYADGAESDELAEEGSGSEILGSDDQTDVLKKTTRSNKPEDHYMPSASDKSDSDDEGEAAVGTDDNGNRRKKNTNTSSSGRRHLAQGDAADDDGIRGRRTTTTEYDYDDEDDFQRAVALSMQQTHVPTDPSGGHHANVIDLIAEDDDDEDGEEGRQLRHALRLSMETTTTTTRSDQRDGPGSHPSAGGASSSRGNRPAATASIVDLSANKGGKPGRSGEILSSSGKASSSRKKLKGPAPSEEDVTYAFKCLDKASKGTISIADISSAAEEFGFGSWTHQQCADMITLFSTSRGGREKMTRADFDKLVETEGCYLPS